MKQNKKFLIAITFLFIFTSCMNFQLIPVRSIPIKPSRENSAPKFVDDMVIYMLSPYNFNPVNGIGADNNGTGTWKSLTEKLPYLEALGINTIWAIGYCSANFHFWNTKCVYANIDPSIVDPALGSETDMKEFVEEAHKRGIKVILDVVTHGVVTESPLVKKHPSWFNKSSWRMADYDYNNIEFREWFKQVWIKYAVEIGIDGFRLDVNIYDSQLWDEIISECMDAGKEIVVFGEWHHYHFAQIDYNFEQGDHKYSVQQLRESHPYRRASAQLDNMDSIKPYVGTSRYLFGYKFLFSGLIPIFYAGDEFNARKTSLPEAVLDLYGLADRPNGGGYVNRNNYSLINWDDINKPENKAFCEDVKKMLKIRSDFSYLINADKDTTFFHSYEHEKIPKEVCLFYNLAGEVLLTAGNKSSQDIRIEVSLPLHKTGLAPYSKFEIVNLMTGKRDILTINQIQSIEIDIKADYKKQGGLGLFLIHPATVQY